ncbi:MAG TPA: MoxR family ATPase [Allosphingosinicella sp.]|jgi:MoxR-like ATPase|nr:MoxR family ATPase [Allosphingosinicella sp.]
MSDRSLGDLLKAGHEGLCPDLIERLPVPWRLRGSPAADYDLTDQALVAAVQTALLLGQPLILAGEPGVGKTSLARALEHRLGLFLHDAVQVKSVTTGLDLFYTFDEVARFRDAGRPRDQKAGDGRQAPKGLRDYVRFSSLGRAILWSAGPDAEVATGSVPSEEIVGIPGIATLRLGDLFPLEFRRYEACDDGSFRHRSLDSPVRSMVLLDELDKAPRDAPNDVLGELEAMSFRIGELDIEIRAQAPTWPIILITSNSERSLPDAFLRRCVFHWIDFPSANRLQKIVAARCVKDYGLRMEDPLVVSATRVFIDLRDKVENKKPATAELISFLVSLIEFGFARTDVIDASDERVAKLFGTMMKTQVDLDAATGKPAAR